MHFKDITNEHFHIGKDKDGSMKVYKKVDKTTAKCVKVCGKYSNRLVGGKIRLSAFSQVWVIK